MIAVGKTCQHRVKTRAGTAAGTHPRLVACDKSATYICPDGEVRTILFWDEHTGLVVGPCHAASASRMLAKDLAFAYPDFPNGYRVAPTEVVDPRAAGWMRHALAETVRQQTGGLKRLDGSGSDDVNVVRIR